MNIPVVPVHPVVAAGDDLSTAVVIVLAILVGAFLLPFLLAWLEPARVEQPRHLARTRRSPQSVPAVEPATETVA